MKFTNSRDGIHRCDISVPARLALRDIAVHFIYDRNVFADDSIRGDAVTLSQRKVMACVKASILDAGLETPHYRVADDGLDEHVEWVMEVFHERFGFPLEG